MFTSTAVASPLKRRAKRGRRLILVDIENVAGGPVTTDAMADWARWVVESAVTVGDNEQVIIGVCHRSLFHSGTAWPAAGVRVRSGQDGADLALLDVLKEEEIASRFEYLTLVSGDGIFSDVIAWLAAQGTQVTVASWAGSLSPRLKLAAASVTYLDEVVGRATSKEIA